MTKLREQCGWCGRPFVRSEGPGRPRRFCRQSCRQRDYESRSRAAELGLNEGELVVTREQLHGLKDRLYVLACAVEDAEREREDNPKRAYEWLLAAARTATAEP